jgi:AAA+ ATPase superfamily predicted ATPase
MFAGRVQELRDLRLEFDRPAPSLVVMYGRRRVGKSTLIQEAAKGRDFVYFQATRDVPQASLAAFKVAAAESLGADPLLAGLQDWQSVLHYLARVAEGRPGLVVAFDEFPYLCDQDQALPSVFQKFVDSGAPAKGRLKLILCGSIIANMEELLAERNPLYGRQTGIFDIAPLPVRDIGAFFPGYTAERIITAYGVFGGIPYYLEVCDPDRTPEQNIAELLLSHRGRLVEEPEWLLQSEVKETARYSAILHAIADGCTKSGEIRNRVGDGKGGKDVGYYLSRLAAMGIINVVRSMDATERERDSRYLIADPLTDFWHRFVRPNMSAINHGAGSAVWEKRIEPMMATYMGNAFERICREHVRWWGHEFLPCPAQKIGKLWSKDYDLDIVGELLDGSFIYGEVKWTHGRVGISVLDHLVASAEASGYGSDKPRHFVLFSRSGFTDDLRARAASDTAVHLVELEAIAFGQSK